MNHFLPYAFRMFGNNKYCFYQDSTLAHKQKMFQGVQKQKILRFPVDEMASSISESECIGLLHMGLHVRQIKQFKNPKVGAI